MAEYSKGLAGVIAGETAISNVEGEAGRLTYRGYDINELTRLPYEAVMWLLLFGELPGSTDTQRLREHLTRQASLSKEDLTLLGAVPLDLHPMRVLQGLMPLLSHRDAGFPGLDTQGARGLDIIARIPTLIAAYQRVRNGRAMVDPREGVGVIENFLLMFKGEAPVHEVETLSVAQVLQMEHSFNASTFTARVVASTMAPVESVLSAAAGALYGRLHGAADQAALEDARRVGCPESAGDFVEQLLAEKGLLMGMGHREYRTVDPRAKILKPMADELSKGRGTRANYETLAALEASFNASMAARGKEVWANVEFYKGAVFETIGIPDDCFTGLFTMARSVGWLAHFIECRQDNRIMRPKALYVGAAPRTVASAGE